MFWNRRSRSCIERTGDNVYSKRFRDGVVAGAGREALEVRSVVAGAGREALEVYSVVIGAGGVEAKDWRGFNGGNSDIG